SSHFYSRGLGSLAKPLQVSVRVSEYPWGSLLKALIFSGLATVCMGLTTTVVHFSGTDGTTVAFSLIGLPFTLGVTWLSLFPGTARIATAAAAYLLTAGTLLLLALNGLACAGKINDWHHWWSGHFMLVGTYRASAGVTLAALATVVIRTWVWRITYLRRTVP
ncbi:MAG TPA: hypothetical protein VFE15_09695, partial [Marmoricola sp.]|nr:hypothetical protein [Marmoricola sp.]